MEWNDNFVWTEDGTTLEDEMVTEEIIGDNNVETLGK